MINNYLVSRSVPVNGEKEVGLSSNIELYFSKFMDETTLTPSTIILKEINGEVAPIDVDYFGRDKKLIIKPELGLYPNTRYELTVKSGMNGIKSSAGETMQMDRVFTFTTIDGVELSPPINLRAKDNKGHLKVEWEPPAKYIPKNELVYEIHVSKSSDKTAIAIWNSSKFGSFKDIEIEIPMLLSEGNYYVYVKARDGDKESDYAAIQIFVEESGYVKEDFDDYEEEIFFEITQMLPSDLDFEFDKGESLIVFNKKIAKEQDFSKLITLFQVDKIKEYEYIEYFSLSRKKENLITEEMITIKDNYLIIDIEEVIKKESCYLLYISEQIKDEEGMELGEEQIISFSTESMYYFSDIDLIRTDMGVFGDYYSDYQLYRMILQESKHILNGMVESGRLQEEDILAGKIPFSLHQYLRYKVAYDGALMSYSYTSSGSSSGSFRLSDLSVERQTSQSGYAAYIKAMKQRLDKWEDEVETGGIGGRASMVTVMKAKNRIVPEVYLTRGEFLGLAGGE